MDSSTSGLLRPGERVIWQGAPARGVRFGLRDLFLVPFSFLWCGFAIFWEVSAAQMGAPPFFLLFGIPFVLIGLAISVGRFTADAWLRGRTRYALTDRRVLIERQRPWGMLQTIELAGLSEVALTPGNEGSGTIRLGPKPSYWRHQGLDAWVPALDPTPQFQRIADARRVFDLIERARR